MHSLKSDAFRIMNDAINAVKPSSLMKDRLLLEGRLFKVNDLVYDLDKYKDVYVIGAGKASAYMAQHLEEILGTGITGGIISTKYGHSAVCTNVDVFEAGHPVIDESSLNVTSKIIGLLENTTERDLVICLLSGGGSALLESLPERIELNEVKKTFELLLSSGADIKEMNVVRKHISQVKGGKLLKRVYPSECLTLIISDVVGDKLETIASGPTYYDSSTFSDSVQILDKYDLTNKLPAKITEYLQKGVKGRVEETLKQSDSFLSKVNNIILGNNLLALKKAGETAESLNYNTLFVSSMIEGESKEAAKVISGIIKQIKYSDFPVKKPACLLLGGETTVTLRGKGKGGRNQEFVLASLIQLKNELDDMILLSCGTDGTDGPTDAAGAFAEKGVMSKVKANNLYPLDFLNENNSYDFFEKTDGLIKTGPTGTNVMDVVIALIV